MRFVRTLISIATLTGASLAVSAWAAPDEQHDSHHPASPATVLVAQAKPTAPAPGMGAAGMPGMETQMKAMQEMHNKMLAAKTPEERDALMAEQMKLMQNGMNMMGGMGPGAMMSGPGDTAARQGMMEKRMDMMQSMMQMMMDRMQSVPAAK